MVACAAKSANIQTKGLHMLKSFVLAVLLIMMASSVYAMSEGCGGACSKCHSLTLNEANKIIKRTGGKVKNVKLSKVRGLFEFTFEKDGQQATGYLDFGKRYIITGPIFDTQTMKQVAETPAGKELKPVTKVDVRKIPLYNSIVMGNQMGRKRIFVFTDPDCPYCGKLHQELKKLVKQDLSLAVYVKMFPLKMHPHAYDKARTILASGSLQVLDQMFAGRQLPNARGKDGKAAVDETIRLGESLGINSTPTMVLPDGSVVTGYWDAAKIRQLMDGGKK